MKTVKLLSIALAAGALVIAPIAEANPFALPTTGVVLQASDQNSSKNIVLKAPRNDNTITDKAFKHALGLFNINQQAGNGNQNVGQNGLATGDIALVGQAAKQNSTWNLTVYAKNVSGGYRRQRNEDCDCPKNTNTIEDHAFRNAIGMFNISQQAGVGNQNVGQNGIAAGH